MRYGHIGSKMFPAGHISREKARKTMQYILAEERKGITWRSLKKYETRNTVAFAYCTGLKDANVIQVFDSNETEDKENIYISEAATKTALKTFEGIAESDPDARNRNRHHCSGG